MASKIGKVLHVGENPAGTFRDLDADFRERDIAWATFDQIHTQIALKLPDLHG
jgi:hypothetical protein